MTSKLNIIICIFKYWNESSECFHLWVKLLSILPWVFCTVYGMKLHCFMSLSFGGFGHLCWHIFIINCHPDIHCFIDSLLNNLFLFEHTAVYLLRKSPFTYISNTLCIYALALYEFCNQIHLWCLLFNCLLCLSLQLPLLTA